MFDVANTWIERQLAASTGTSSFLYLLLGGALASLLPCVYPLYPITAAILRERGSNLGRWVHPVTYYVGLCLVYLAFGVIASIAGGAFNTVLRLPLANFAIGSTLLVLSLATVGLFHFPMLSLEEGGRGGVVSTLLMGAAAGLLSSACVGPVVVSILVQIAAQTDAVNATTMVAAALKMAAFGMGVGLPLLLIGLLGVALPRGGRWMLYVQWAFGVLIAYFSLGYFAKGLLGLGFDEEAGRTIVLGALLLLGAAYARQSAEKPSSERAKGALVLLTGVIGFFVLGRAILTPALGGAASRGGEVAAAQKGPATEKIGSLTWYLDKDAAYASAVQSGRPVFVDFHGNWCTNCMAFQERTQKDARLRGALERAILLKVYDGSPLFASYREDPRYPELRVGLPFFIITDAKGELLYKTNDFTKTEEMALFLSDS